MNQHSFKEDPFNGPPMEEGETEGGLQLGHWLPAGRLPLILTPPTLSAPSFGLHERVWYGNTGIAV